MEDPARSSIKDVNDRFGMEIHRVSEKNRWSYTINGVYILYPRKDIKLLTDNVLIASADQSRGEIYLGTLPAAKSRKTAQRKKSVGLEKIFVVSVKDQD